MTEIEFPRIILCHGDGQGYNTTKVNQFGYKNYVNLLYGNSTNVSSYGWVSSKVPVKDMFEELYRKPNIETIINHQGSFMKLNGSIKENLSWIEVPMVHPEGRCLKLDFPMTMYTETTLILKFHDIKDFNGSLEITITGKLQMILNFE